VWTNENRGRSDRSGLRYPSDLTDEEWALTEPLIPPARRGGAKRTVDVREVVNGLMYVLSTGCQRRAIPKDLPPNARATSQRRQAPSDIHTRETPRRRRLITKGFFEQRKSAVINVPARRSPPSRCSATRSPPRRAIRALAAENGLWLWRR
jgi:transposase